MPWYIAAIIFFALGVTAERFIIDRRFIRTLETMRKMNDRLGDLPKDED